MRAGREESPQQGACLGSRGSVPLRVGCAPCSAVLLGVYPPTPRVLEVLNQPSQATLHKGLRRFPRLQKNPEAEKQSEEGTGRENHLNAETLLHLQGH